MSSKHFITSESASSAVVSSSQGVVATHPGILLAAAEKVVYRPQTSTPKVTLLSGGGSGHEPAHAGYVGEGMLDAAVCGEIFASPTARQIAAGLAAIDSPKGTLVIVKNYTGDRLNFALAVERARAKGRNIETVTVSDDVAVGREKGSLVGRRGLAGTVLVHKVAGAAAEKGLDLPSVMKIAQHVADNLATVGASLGRCSIPGRTTADDAEDALRPDELEIGMGIHNEPGYKRVSPIPSHPALISELLSLILDTSDNDRGFLPRKSGDKVVLLVNNLGGVSNLELNVLVNETVHQLGENHGIVPARVFAGAFMTSLNAPGFSITLLALPSDAETKPETVLELLDAYTSAVGWGGSLNSSAWTSTPPSPAASLSAASLSTESLPVIPTNAALASRILNAILTQVTLHEPSMTDYDTLVGDGDCGITLLSGSQALLSRGISTSNLLQATLDIATIIETTMGGTSGALYGIFLSAFATGLANQGGSSSFPAIAAAAKYALDTLQKYTPARVGDRTLMDALIPFVEAIYERREEGAEAALTMGVEAAEIGYRATKGMAARLGRASYVDAAAFEGDGVPDPGALGVMAVVKGILEGVKEG
ncbi:dihydroxyacetone kinase [Wilcoxina mikolae CBS 423.85]|nr:dihydroxyacetone kinase [Wilcoxina mikolae CBS 423.85]